MTILEITRVASTPPRAAPKILAVFNLDDYKERAMLDIMTRMHADGWCQASTLKRITNAAGQRVIVELAIMDPGSPKAAWVLVRWNIDEIGIGWHKCKSLASARAAFHAA